MRQLKINPNITNRENETIERYLQEIGRERRITLDEEVELAHRIHQGDELALDFPINWNNLRASHINI